MFVYITNCTAEIKIYEGYGEYCMSEFEDAEISKQRAIENAKQNALEKSGVFLKSFSRSINSNLVNDEVIAINQNIINIHDVNFATVLNGDGKSKIYQVKLKIALDTDEFKKQAQQDKQALKLLVAQSRDLEKRITEQNQRLEKLKIEMAKANSNDDKQKLIDEYNGTNKRFLAIQKLRESYESLHNREFSKALKSCNESIQLDSEHSAPYLMRATIYMGSNNLNMAIQDLDKAIKINSLPDITAVAYHGRGVIYSFQKQYNKVISDCNESIQLDSNSTAVYLLRAKAYKELGNYSKALEDLNKSIEIGKKDSDIYSERAFVNLKLRNLKQAVEDCDRALELNSDNVVAYKISGSANVELKNYEKALENLNHSLKYDPLNPETYTFIAMAHFGLERYLDVINDCNKIIQLKPNQNILAVTYYLRGNAYIKRGESANGVKDLLKAQEFGYRN